MLSRSERVKQFTEESSGKVLPTHPRLMTREEVNFIVRMNCEELMELLSTVLVEGEDVKEALHNIVEISVPPVNYTLNGKTNVDLMAEQVDAFVDIDYYNENAAAKAGFNCDKVFDIVHEANMNKKFPDGTFHRDISGKVIKPDGWCVGDVEVEVERWVRSGTWS